MGFERSIAHRSHRYDASFIDAPASECAAGSARVNIAFIVVPRNPDTA